MICGSEGTLGIITEATMRLQHRPKWRATASVRFDRFMKGVDAVRQIAQSPHAVLAQSINRHGHDCRHLRNRNHLGQVPEPLQGSKINHGVRASRDHATAVFIFLSLYPCLPGRASALFQFYCVGDTTGDLGKALEKWKQLKRISMEVLAEQGATVTHHHAVGRDHRYGYEQQTSPLFRQTLAAGKQCLDPHGILNPGVLIDPKDKDIGITGVSSL